MGCGLCWACLSIGPAPRPIGRIGAHLVFRFYSIGHICPSRLFMFFRVAFSDMGNWLETKPTSRRFRKRVPNGRGKRIPGQAMRQERAREWPGEIREGRNAGARQLLGRGRCGLSWSGLHRDGLRWRRSRLCGLSGRGRLNRFHGLHGLSRLGWLYRNRGNLTGRNLLELLFED